MYIYEQSNWPHFIWRQEKISNLLSEASFWQGKILGKVESLGFALQQKTALKSMADEITKSSEIEGELLNAAQVRSSIARRLNIRGSDSGPSSHYIDGIVEMMVDATHNYRNELTLDRLYGWHASLFPAGYSGIYQIKVGQLRDDRDGLMQVVSSRIGGEIVYYEAPPAHKLPVLLDDFLHWINDAENSINPIIKAAIAHLWFISLHPFEDGNGRIGRALTDMMLSRAEDTPYRFYSMSAQIQKDKKEYYEILERTQKGDLDITEWLEWFLQCLIKAIHSSSDLVDKTIHKALCWQEFNKTALDNNQQKIINMLLDGFEGHLTSSKWAKICKCSQDTASRSIKYLIENGILQREGAGRNTHYVLRPMQQHVLTGRR